MLVSAIEKVYPNNRDFTTILAYHWAQAHREDKELHYSALAGYEALSIGAYQDAKTFLQRALELQPARVRTYEIIRDKRRVFIATQLAEAQAALGEDIAGETTLTEALAWAGYSLPTSKLALFAGILKETGVQLFHRFFPQLFIGRRAQHRDDILQIGRIQRQLIGIYMYMGQKSKILPVFYMALRQLNVVETAGISGFLAESYGATCLAAGTYALHRIARYYAKLSHRIFDTETMNPQELAELRIDTTAFYYIGIGDIAQAKERLNRLTQALGTYSLPFKYEHSILESMIQRFEHNYDDFFRLWQRVYTESQRFNVPEGLFLSVSGLAEYHLMHNDLEQAAPYLEMLADMLDKEARLANQLSYWGIKALAAMVSEDYEMALDAANHMMKWLSDEAKDPRNVFFYCCFFSIADVHLHVLKQKEIPLLDRECLMTNLYWGIQATVKLGRIFPVAEAGSCYLRGQWEWLHHNVKEAQKWWHSAIEKAEQMNQPGEKAFALYDLAYSIDDEILKKEYLQESYRLFSEIGDYLYIKQRDWKGVVNV